MVRSPRTRLGAGVRWIQGFGTARGPRTSGAPGNKFLLHLQGTQQGRSMIDQTLGMWPRRPPRWCWTAFSARKLAARMEITTTRR
jgi:hypothetical protein